VYAVVCVHIISIFCIYTWWYCLYFVLIISGFVFSQIGATPLHWAAREGRIAAVEWLLGRGLDINAKDKVNIR
jgi:hypothetical protein